MLIYKLLLPEEWEVLRSVGQTKGSPVDVRDGFVHFSAGEQVNATALNYFHDAEGVMILAVESDPLGGDLKWEPSRGGALFPHLYRELRMEDVKWARQLERVDGAYRFSESSTG